MDQHVDQQKKDSHSGVNTPAFTAARRRREQRKRARARLLKKGLDYPSKKHVEGSKKTQRSPRLSRVRKSLVNKKEDQVAEQRRTGSECRFSHRGRDQGRRFLSDRSLQRGRQFDSRRNYQRRFSHAKDSVERSRLQSEKNHGRRSSSAKGSSDRDRLDSERESHRSSSAKRSSDRGISDSERDRRRSSSAKRSSDKEKSDSERNRSRSSSTKCSPQRGKERSSSRSKYEDRKRDKEIREDKCSSSKVRSEAVKSHVVSEVKHRPSKQTVCNGKWASLIAQQRGVGSSVARVRRQAKARARKLAFFKNVKKRKLERLKKKKQKELEEQKKQGLLPEPVVHVDGKDRREFEEWKIVHEFAQQKKAQEQEKLRREFELWKKAKAEEEKLKKEFEEWKKCQSVCDRYIELDTFKPVESPDTEHVENIQAALTQWHIKHTPLKVVSGAERHIFLTDDRSSDVDLYTRDLYSPVSSAGLEDSYSPVSSEDLQEETNGNSLQKRRLHSKPFADYWENVSVREQKLHEKESDWDTIYSRVDPSRENNRVGNRLNAKMEKKIERYGFRRDLESHKKNQCVTAVEGGDGRVKDSVMTATVVERNNWQRSPRHEDVYIVEEYTLNDGVSKPIINRDTARTRVNNSAVEGPTVNDKGIVAVSTVNKTNSDIAVSKVRNTNNAIVGSAVSNTNSTVAQSTVNNSAVDESSVNSTVVSGSAVNSTGVAGSTIKSAAISVKVVNPETIRRNTIGATRWDCQWKGGKPMDKSVVKEETGQENETEPVTAVRELSTLEHAVQQQGQDGSTEQGEDEPVQSVLKVDRLVFHGSAMLQMTCMGKQLLCYAQVKKRFFNKVPKDQFSRVFKKLKCKTIRLQQKHINDINKFLQGISSAVTYEQSTMSVITVQDADNLYNHFHQHAQENVRRESLVKSSETEDRQTGTATCRTDVQNAANLVGAGGVRETGAEVESPQSPEMGPLVTESPASPMEDTKLSNGEKNIPTETATSSVLQTSSGTEDKGNNMALVGAVSPVTPPANLSVPALTGDHEPTPEVSSAVSVLSHSTEDQETSLVEVTGIDSRATSLTSGAPSNPVPRNEGQESETSDNHKSQADANSTVDQKSDTGVSASDDAAKNKEMEVDYSTDTGDETRDVHSNDVAKNKEMEVDSAHSTDTGDETRDVHSNDVAKNKEMEVDSAHSTDTGDETRDVHSNDVAKNKEMEVDSAHSTDTGDETRDVHSNDVAKNKEMEVDSAHSTDTGDETRDVHSNDVAKNKEMEVDSAHSTDTGDETRDVHSNDVAKNKEMEVDSAHSTDTGDETRDVHSNDVAKNKEMEVDSAHSTDTGDEARDVHTDDAEETIPYEEPNEMQVSGSPCHVDSAVKDAEERTVEPETYDATGRELNSEPAGWSVEELSTGHGYQTGIMKIGQGSACFIYTNQARHFMLKDIRTKLFTDLNGSPFYKTNLSAMCKNLGIPTRRCLPAELEAVYKLKQTLGETVHKLDKIITEKDLIKLQNMYLKRRREQGVNHDIERNEPSTKIKLQKKGKNNWELTLDTAKQNMEPTVTLEKLQAGLTKVGTVSLPYVVVKGRQMILRSQLRKLVISPMCKVRAKEFVRICENELKIPCKMCTKQQKSRILSAFPEMKPDSIVVGNSRLLLVEDARTVVEHFKSANVGGGIAMYSNCRLIEMHGCTVVNVTRGSDSFILTKQLRDLVVQQTPLQNIQFSKVCRRLALCHKIQSHEWHRCCELVPSLNNNGGGAVALISLADSERVLEFYQDYAAVKSGEKPDLSSNQDNSSASLDNDVGGAFICRGCSRSFQASEFLHHTHQATGSTPNSSGTGETTTTVTPCTSTIADLSLPEDRNEVGQASSQGSSTDGQETSSLPFKSDSVQCVSQKPTVLGPTPHAGGNGAGSPTSETLPSPTKKMRMSVDAESVSCGVEIEHSFTASAENSAVTAHLVKNLKRKLQGSGTDSFSEKQKVDIDEELTEVEMSCEDSDVPLAQKTVIPGDCGSQPHLQEQHAVWQASNASVSGDAVLGQVHSAIIDAGNPLNILPLKVCTSGGDTKAEPGMGEMESTSEPLHHETVEPSVVLECGVLDPKQDIVTDNVMRDPQLLNAGGLLPTMDSLQGGRSSVEISAHKSVCPQAGLPSDQRVAYTADNASKSFPAEFPGVADGLESAGLPFMDQVVETNGPQAERELTTEHYSVDSWHMPACIKTEKLGSPCKFSITDQVVVEQKLPVVQPQGVLLEASPKENCGEQKLVPSSDVSNSGLVAMQSSLDTGIGTAETLNGVVSADNAIMIAEESTQGNGTVSVPAPSNTSVVPNQASDNDYSVFTGREIKPDTAGYGHDTEVEWNSQSSARQVDSNDWYDQIDYVSSNSSSVTGGFLPRNSFTGNGMTSSKRASANSRPASGTSTGVFVDYAPISVDMPSQSNWGGSSGIPSVGGSSGIPLVSCSSGRPSCSVRQNLPSHAGGSGTSSAGCSTELTLATYSTSTSQGLCGQGWPEHVISPTGQGQMGTGQQQPCQPVQRQQFGTTNSGQLVWQSVMAQIERGQLAITSAMQELQAHCEKIAEEKRRLENQNGDLENELRTLKEELARSQREVMKERAQQEELRVQLCAVTAQLQQSSNALERVSAENKLLQVYCKNNARQGGSGDL